MYRADREATLAKIEKHFRIAQPDFQRYLQRRAHRDDPSQPALTVLEWMALSSTCSALAQTYETAAALWDQIQPSRPEHSIASAYRATSHGYQDEAARAELYAAFAPAGR